MKITFKNKCNIPLFVIPTCSESFFKDMIYKERFPTSGNDASINGYTFNIINQSLSTKIRMKDLLFRIIEYGAIAFGVNALLPTSPVSGKTVLGGLFLLAILFVLALIITPGGIK
jgi:hypothetical protein